MRVTLYTSKLGEEGLPYLVKEFSTNLAAIGKISNPRDIAEIFESIFDLGSETEEHVYMCAVNTAGKMLGMFKIFQGTANWSIIQPREIFMKALLVGATSIMLVHNHPSGSTQPSEKDLSSTERICSVGKMLGITVLDHIIIAHGGGYFSFLENDLIK